MAETAVVIALLPFIAFLIQVSIGKKLPRHGDFISVLAIAASFVLSVPIFLELLKTGNVSDSLTYTWIALPSISGNFSIVIGVLVNPLTSIMLVMVTLCSMLIHVFSTGYMHGESRYHLFFAYISLFSAAMLGLVVSNNLLSFFICWELMGLCSYLLIGFYYQKPSAINASLKAFMTTRIGDVCFFLGICGLFYLFGTSEFSTIYAADYASLSHKTILGMPALVFIGIMLLMGTIGKSAQFPLQVWLPDAMEGPTPVSALIHAATMVAAGVFLLIRMYPFLEASHLVLPIVAYVGCITAFLAALIAIVQVDIKKVLAYSTISQLGYMVLGVGVGAFSAGFMHLITHACFKSCLFLCSGSVIHAVHTQDMREMGGLKSKMPVTFLTMLIATLAISGVPFFSGFVSKDRILGAVLGYGMEHPVHFVLPLLGFLTAGITAFYMFRLIYMTFFGHARDEHKHHHAHEQPLPMVIPLVVLSVFSFAFWFSGATGLHVIDQSFSLTTHWFDTALENAQKAMGISLHHGNEEIHHQAHSLALILSLVVAGTGIFVSSIMYLRPLISPLRLKNMLSPIYNVLWNKYYFDELYTKWIVGKALLGFNALLARFDDFVIDRIFVDGWGDITMAVKSIVGKFDDIVIDRIMVDGSGDVMRFGGWVLRRFQTGKVQQYLIFMVMLLVLAYIWGAGQFVYFLGK